MSIISEQYARRQESTQRSDAECYFEQQQRNQAFLQQKITAGEVHTALPISNTTIYIQLRVPEPKAFDGKKKEAKSCLKQVKKYFIAA